LLLLLGCLWLMMLLLLLLLLLLVLLLLLLIPMTAVHVPGRVAVFHCSQSHVEHCSVRRQRFGAQPCCSCCCQVLFLVTQVPDSSLPAPHGLGASA
jgi:hypothetical protein